jgi:uncharacterized protein (TIGR00369 family)
MSSGEASSDPRISAEAFERLIREQMAGHALPWELESLTRGHARMRLLYDEAFIRPGGTLSGPTLFTLADLALYAAVLSEVGSVPLAVTTDMTIHFLRRPPPAALCAEASILKAGRKLVIGTIGITSEATGELVCHATGTYAIPPARPEPSADPG